MTGHYQDGEFIETYVAPACGHEMFDESEIDEEGRCVNCSDLSGGSRPKPSNPLIEESSAPPAQLGATNELSGSNILSAVVLPEPTHSEGTAKALTSGEGEALGVPRGGNPESSGAQNLSDIRDLQHKLGAEAAGLVWALKQLDKYFRTRNTEAEE